MKMCKFTNRLFVFASLCTLTLLQLEAHANPIAVQRNAEHLLEQLFDQDYDYDLHYDQRQRGGENLRLNLDGFFIGLPVQDAAAGSAIMDWQETLEEQILQAFNQNPKSLSITTAAPDIANQNYNKMKPDSSKMPLKSNADAVMGEIPAPKKDVEARHHAEPLLDENFIKASKTKFHIYQLLNFLRGPNRV